MRLIDADKLKKQFDLKSTNPNYRVDNHNIWSIIKNAPTVEAIPKADYEARLKADIVTILEDLKKEMNPIKECEYQIYGKEHWGFVGKCQDVIQQKINVLRGDEDAR